MRRATSALAARIVILVAASVAAATLPAGDCNRNGFSDWIDIASGASADCDQNGVPDECDAAPPAVGFSFAGALPTPPLEPTAVTAADLDGDGHLDLAAAFQDTDRIAVFRNRGGGDLGPASYFPCVRIGPLSSSDADIAAGDLDRDGDADLAVVYWHAPSASLLENDGDGRFTATGSLTPRNPPTRVALADLDGDGAPDVVTASLASGGPVSAFFNDGGGTFGLEALGPADGVRDFAIADFDGDGDLDVATTAGICVRILFNHGARNFEVGPLFRQDQSHRIAAGDIDGDGDADLMTGSLLAVNDGSGVFEHRPLGLEAPPALALALADLDRDGDADVVFSPGADVRVLASEDGRLVDTAISYGSGGVPGVPPVETWPGRWPLSLADLTGDGLPDLAIAGGAARSVAVFENRPHSRRDCDGDGALDACAGVATDCDADGVSDRCAALEAIAADCDQNGVPDRCDGAGGAVPDCNRNGVPDACDVAGGTSLDLDGDGAPDECGSDCDGDGVLDWEEIAAGVADCDGDRAPDHCDFLDAMRFAESTAVGVGEAFGDIAVADLDGDGLLDLAAVRAFGVDFLLGLGNRRFRRARGVEIGSMPSGVAVADFDDDGIADLATANVLENVSVLFGEGGLAFAPPLNMATGGEAERIVAIVASDLDGDGNADLATWSAKGAAVSIHLNRGGRRFAPFVHKEFRREVFRHLPALVAADLRPGGGAELVVSGSSLPEVHVLAVDAIGNVGDEVVGLLAGLPAALAAGDIDADGDADVVVGVGGDSAAALLRNPGDGRLEFTGRFAARRSQPGLALADLDDDGDLDLATDTVVLENRGRGALARGASFAPPPSWFLADGIIAGDLDADGRPDIVTGGVRLPSQLLVRWNTLGPASSDCNANGVPDGCEIAAGLDCDASGVPDDCDIAAGRAADCDGNGIPDGCDLRVELRLGESRRLGDNYKLLAAGDFDGDRDIDVVAALHTGLAIFLNRGGGELDPGAGDFPSTSYKTLSAADLDGGGGEEPVALSAANEVVVLRHAGGASFDVLRLAAPELGNVRAHGEGDVDGDGDIDLLVTAAAGDVAVFENAGDGSFPSAARAVARPGPGVAIAAGDLDGDGRADLVLPSAEVSRAVVVLIAGESGGFTPIETAAPEESSPGRVSLLDVDADGDLDVVTAYGLYRNDGSGRVDRHEGISGRILDESDLDLDVDVDLLRAPARGLEAIENLGAGAFAAPAAIPFDLGPISQLTAADLDGDGDPDLAVIVDNSVLHVIRNASDPSPDRDRNGVLDRCESEPAFHRGDPDASGSISIADAVFLLRFLFLGGPRPPCMESADFDDGGAVNLADAVSVLRFLFLGGAGPAAPGAPGVPCGPDPEGSAELGCRLYHDC